MRYLHLNPLKKFLFLTGLIVFGINLSFTALVKFFPKFIILPENAMWNYVNNVISNTTMDNDPHTLILGNSNLQAAIDPSQLDNAVILSTPAASFFDIYHLLNKYLQNRLPPKIIISHFQPKPIISKTFWEMFIRFSELTFKEYSEIYENFKKYDTFPQGPTNKIAFFLEIYSFRLKLITKNIHIFQENLFSQDNYNAYKRMYEDVKKGRGFLTLYKDRVLFPKRLFETIHSIAPATKVKFYDHTFQEIQKVYVEKIINLTNKYNIKLVFLNLPYSPDYFSKNELELLSQKISQLHSDICKLPNLTCLLKNEIDLPKKLFFDFSHLLPEGARKFTNYTKKRLRVLKLM